ncbi:hypothetical protein A2U01_0019718, partial [Trifolium medium]|nr:hypothetical protein [Trifolium medium]
MRLTNLRMRILQQRARVMSNELRNAVRFGVSWTIAEIVVNVIIVWEE